jgi:hypothetical protein
VSNLLARLEHRALLHVATFRMNYHRRKRALLEAQAEAQHSHYEHWAQKVGDLRWGES